LGWPTAICPPQTNNYNDATRDLPASLQRLIDAVKAQLGRATKSPAVGMRIIRGRKAVITGAASGIGKAIALALAAAGADLFLIDRDADGMERVAREAAGHGIEVVIAVCDLTIPEDITATISRVLATWDRVHILVNCAGVLCYGEFHRTADERWRQTIAVNLLAPMLLSHQLSGRKGEYVRATSAIVDAFLHATMYHAL